MKKEQQKAISYGIEQAFKKIGIYGRGAKAEISKILKVSPAAVGSWINYDTNDAKLPSLKHLMAISKLTGMSLDRIVNGMNYQQTPLYQMADDVLSPTSQERVLDLENTIDLKEVDLAVVNPDDSMLNLANNAYYPKGSILVFKKQEGALRSEDLVLVKIQRREQTFVLFRQFLTNAGDDTFCAFNPAYGAIADFDSYEVLAHFAYQIIQPNS